MQGILYQNYHRGLTPLELKQIQSVAYIMIVYFILLNVAWAIRGGDRLTKNTSCDLDKEGILTLEHKELFQQGQGREHQRNTSLDTNKKLFTS